jgi:hypothetical protein
MSRRRLIVVDILLVAAYVAVLLWLLFVVLPARTPS